MLRELYSLADRLNIWDVRGLAWEMSLPQFLQWQEYMAWCADEMKKARARDDELSKNRRRAGVSRGGLP